MAPQVGGSPATEARARAGMEVVSRVEGTAVAVEVREKVAAAEVYLAEAELVAETAVVVIAVAA